MRIAYLLERDVSGNDAVVKKVAAQCHCWKESGHSVAVFALSAGSGVASAFQDTDVDVEVWRRWRDWWTRYPRLADRVMRWQADIVYFRFSSYFPALGRLMRQVPVVIEINTNDVDEYRSTMTRKAYAYHRFTRKKLIRQSRGLVTVTAELAACYESFGKPIAVVPNGMDLAAAPELPLPENDRPQLVFLGQGNKGWHGADKVIRMAELFPEWDFRLIGDPTFGVKQTLPNVQIFPYMDATDYLAHLAKADIGLGPLALHRKAMQEASPLKVREYLARGLPTITAHKDPDFPRSVPFMLELPNTVDNIDRSRERIAEFVRRSRGTRVPRDAIRHLDIAEKERMRTDFFSRLSREA